MDTAMLFADVDDTVETLTCSVCCQDFSNYATHAYAPRMMPCGHSLCATCIAMLTAKTCEGCGHDHIKTCPICRKEFDADKDVVINFALIDVIVERRIHQEQKNVESESSTGNSGCCSRMESTSGSTTVDEAQMMSLKCRLCTRNFGSSATQGAAPCALPCGHSVCLSCILPKKGCGECGHETLKVCPSCHESFDVEKDVVVNFAIVDIVAQEEHRPTPLRLCRNCNQMEAEGECDSARKEMGRTMSTCTKEKRPITGADGEFVIDLRDLDGENFDRIVQILAHLAQ